MAEPALPVMAPVIVFENVLLPEKVLWSARRVVEAPEPPVAASVPPLKVRPEPMPTVLSRIVSSP